MKKLLLVSLLAFIVFYVATQPAEAALTGKAVLHAAAAVAHGGASFLVRLNHRR